MLTDPRSSQPAGRSGSMSGLKSSLSSLNMAGLVYVHELLGQNPFAQANAHTSMYSELLPSAGYPIELVSAGTVGLGPYAVQVQGEGLFR